MVVYNPMKYALSKILDGNIVIDGTAIDILTEYPPNDELDCINLVDRPENPSNNLFIYDVLSPLDPGHPYYDPENPAAEYPQQTSRQKDVVSIMDIHVWANKGDVRDEIVTKLMDIIEDAVMFNYKYCVNYNKTSTVCATTGNPCDALTVMNALGVQGKCPYADILDDTSIYWRNPSTYFDLTNITGSTLVIKGEQNIDELAIVPEVYHSVVPIEYTLARIKTVDVLPNCAIDKATELEILEPKLNNTDLERL